MVGRRRPTEGGVIDALTLRRRVLALFLPRAATAKQHSEPEQSSS
jgi:hypothetical protein